MKNVSISLKPGHLVIVKVDPSLHERIKTCPEQGAKLFSEEFQREYPNMKKMDPSFFAAASSNLSMTSYPEVCIESMNYYKRIHRYEDRFEKKKIEISKRVCDSKQLSSLNTVMSQSTQTPFSLLASLASALGLSGITREGLAELANAAPAAAPKAAPKAAAKGKAASKAVAKVEDAQGELELIVKLNASQLSHFISFNRKPTKDEITAVAGILDVNFVAKDEVFKVAKKTWDEETIRSKLSDYKLTFEGDSAPKAAAKAAAKPKAEAAAPKAAAKAAPKAAANQVKGVKDARGQYITIDVDGKPVSFVCVDCKFGKKNEKVVVGRLSSTFNSDASKTKSYLSCARQMSDQEMAALAAQGYKTVCDEVVTDNITPESNSEVYHALVEAGILDEGEEDGEGEDGEEEDGEDEDEDDEDEDEKEQ